MLIRKGALTLLLVFFTFLLNFSMPSAGEILYLKNGKRIEGRLIFQSEQIIKLETPDGIQSINRADIKVIKRTPSVMDDYHDRLKTIRENDAQGYFELFAWCKKNGLKTQAAEAFEKAKRIDPNHDGVNLELGKIRYQGKWYTHEELEERGIRLYEGKWMSEADIMKVRRMVQYQGKWMTPLEKVGLQMADMMRNDLKMQVEVLHTDHTFILSRFPARVAETFGKRAEQTWNIFFSLLQPHEKEEKWIRKTVIYLMDGFPAYHRFFDEFLVKQNYISKGEEDFYKSSSGYPNYFPRPFILTCMTRSMRDVEALHALTVHNMAHLLLWRFKKTIPVYPWFDEAFAHYVEERVMRYARIVCIYPDGYDAEQVFVEGFSNSVQWKQQLKYLPDHPRVSSFRTIMEIPQGCFNSLQLCKAWSILTFLFDRHKSQMRTFVDLMMVSETQEQALMEAFGWTPGELDEHWKDYIREEYPK